jgi:hypothetical protein
LCAAKGRAVEKACGKRRRALVIRLRQHGAFQLLQAQVILKLARIFHQVYLRVAVRAQTDAHAFPKEQIRLDNPVAEIPLRRRAGADKRTRAPQQMRFFIRDVNRMHARKTLVEEAFRV